MPDSVSYRAVRMTGLKAGDPKPVILKSGEYSIETVTHHWADCDVCGSSALINEKDLKAIWTCPTCQRSSARMSSPKTPICKGRTVKGEKMTHEPVEMTTTDPAPGRACKMSPRCEGKHRKATP